MGWLSWAQTKFARLLQRLRKTTNTPASDEQREQSLPGGTSGADDSDPPLRVLRRIAYSTVDEVKKGERLTGDRGLDLEPSVYLVLKAVENGAVQMHAEHLSVLSNAPTTSLVGTSTPASSRTKGLCGSSAKQSSRSLSRFTLASHSRTKPMWTPLQLPSLPRCPLSRRFRWRMCGHTPNKSTIPETPNGARSSTAGRRDRRRVVQLPHRTYSVLSVGRLHCLMQLNATQWDGERRGGGNRVETALGARLREEP